MDGILGHVGEAIGRSVLLGAAVLLLSAESCGDDHKKRGESQLNGDVDASFLGDGNIEVRVFGRNETTTTDSEGDFSLEDRVAGPLTLLFFRADDVEAHLDVPPFPRGSVVELGDIDIDAFDSDASSDPPSLRFRGRVTEVACDEATIWVEGEIEPGDGEFPIRTTDARISDRNDLVVSCSSVMAGASVDVNGRLEDDGAITRASVTDRDLPR